MMILSQRKTYFCNISRLIKKKNSNGRLAVLGFTDWPEEFKVTPFMRYINGYGHQFGYAMIKDGEYQDFTLFYTSNISISKKFLLEQPYLFDEDFKTYGWEDIELGYRLYKKGLNIVYNSKATTRHYHKMDIDYFVNRQITVGKGAKKCIVTDQMEQNSLLK